MKDSNVFMWHKASYAWSTVRSRRRGREPVQYLSATQTKCQHQQGERSSSSPVAWSSNRGWPLDSGPQPGLSWTVCWSSPPPPNHPCHRFLASCNITVTHWRFWSGEFRATVNLFSVKCQESCQSRERNQHIFTCEELEKDIFGHFCPEKMSKTTDYQNSCQ